MGMSGKIKLAELKDIDVTELLSNQVVSNQPREGQKTMSWMTFYNFYKGNDRTTRAL